MDYPNNRAEAKRIGSEYYFTGRICSRGHMALRKTKGSCVECMKEDWKISNQKREKYFKEYNQRGNVKDKKNEWYLEHKDQVIAAAKTRPVEQLREYRNAWKENNKLQVRADTKARRRKHRQATPPWLSRKHKSEIRQLYQIAITMSQTTGEQYVVDHIIPLRSNFVCGLHVPWNLRVITQEENLKKSNKIVDSSLE